MDIKRIINEAFEEFDFLNHDKLIKEEQVNSILTTPQFTKSFVNDVVNNFKSKIILDKTSTLDAGAVNDEDIVDGDEPLNIDYTTKFKYLAKDNKYIELAISIEGENISYKLGSEYDAGDYYTKPTSEVWFEYIEWDEINVSLYNRDFDLINDNLLKDLDKLTIKRFILNFINPYFTLKTQ